MKFGEWMPVTEAVPADGACGDWSEDVLCVMERPDYNHVYYEIFVGYYNSEEGWYTYMHDSTEKVGIRRSPIDKQKRMERNGERIVAWMPLPKLPEKYQEHEIEKCPWCGKKIVDD